MKKIDKLINKIEEMIKEANKKADICSSVEYDCGFYVAEVMHWKIF
ncbi:hypothetical protein [Alkaliphilus sp. B6464]|nr:hypothetical protein [Alkaliphilus sp. B6464]QUH21811.1 hypothetical protein HYG84_17905 [Alkaliphilus sp. B6464]